MLFHGKRHPAEMGKAELEAFLTALAVERNVAASTQTQALSALLFLYREVLGVDLPWLTEVTRAKQPARLPSVLTRFEVQALLKQVDEPLMDLIIRQSRRRRRSYGEPTSSGRLPSTGKPYSHSIVAGGLPEMS